MSQPVLQVRHLDAGYGKLQILSDVSLEVNPGAQVLVFGANGAGKSTLLKAVMGFLNVTGGEVEFTGRPLSKRSPEEIVSFGVGYVPQLDNVFASLTVEENLELGGVLLGRKKRGRIHALYDLFPVLAEKRRQSGGSLSGGQRQLLAMARALMTEPRLLLLDEPTAGLAPAVVSEMFETIKNIGATGASILMVEQNAKQALAYVDRGYVMESGRVRFEGAATELLTKEDIAELYLGKRAE